MRCGILWSTRDAFDARKPTSLRDDDCTYRVLIEYNNRTKAKQETRGAFCAGHPNVQNLGMRITIYSNYYDVVQK